MKVPSFRLHAILLHDQGALPWAWAVLTAGLPWLPLVLIGALRGALDLTH